MIFEMEENKRSFSRQHKLTALFFSMLLIGSSLAANIVINSGGKTEFGQGILMTTSCDDNITVSPKVTFNNANNGKFELVELSIRDISNACINKAFVLNLFSETSSAPSNSYGPIVFTFVESGTAGLHFELISDFSSLAYIGTSDIETQTPGFGAYGLTKYIGSSQLEFSALLSSSGSNYLSSQSQKFTLQTSDISSLSSFPRTDEYLNICSTLSNSSIRELNDFFTLSNKRTDELLMQIDASESFVADYMSLQYSQKVKRASEYQQLSRTGLRLLSFLLGTIQSCSAHVTSLSSGLTNLEKIDALNAIVQALNDSEDVILANIDTFNAMSAESSQYL